MKLAEAEKVLTETKATTAEAKATLETEIAETRSFEGEAKASQEVHSCLWKLTKNSFHSKTIGRNNSSREQESIKHEDETRHNELQFVMNQLENKVIKTTVPIVTETPGTNHTSNTSGLNNKQANAEEVPSQLVNLQVHLDLWG